MKIQINLRLEMEDGDYHKRGAKIVVDVLEDLAVRLGYRGLYEEVIPLKDAEGNRIGEMVIIED